MNRDPFEWLERFLPQSKLEYNLLIKKTLKTERNEFLTQADFMLKGMWNSFEAVGHTEKHAKNYLAIKILQYIILSADSDLEYREGLTLPDVKLWQDQSDFYIKDGQNVLADWIHRK